MRYSIHLLSILALVSSTVLAQDPGPSPTASIGCEPHGDHWHCDGPASTTVSSTTATSSTIPSPTESTGCELHGDHWHCDGPAETGSTAASASSMAPSPTESTGCEPHGDHWHCDGPAETGSAGDEEGGTGAMGVHGSLLVGLSLVAAVLNV